MLYQYENENRNVIGAAGVPLRLLQKDVVGAVVAP
jgi:hypothetical protein